MDKLGRPGHYTLFAPTNEAFNKLSPGHLQRMMGDKSVIAGTLVLVSSQFCMMSLRRCISTWAHASGDAVLIPD